MSEKAANKNFFSKAGEVIMNFFRGTKAELKRVIWPTRKEIANNTVIVITTVIIVGVIIWALGLLFHYLVRIIVGT